MIEICFFRGGDKISEAKADKDQPLFSIKRDGSDFECSAMTMEYCEQVLRASGDKKMIEIRACLEGAALLFQFLMKMLIIFGN